MKKFLTLLILFFLLLFSENIAHSQQANFSTGTNFNTTIEYSTGTWCATCPGAHSVINTIRNNYPDITVIAYHGYVGSPDPWVSYSAGMLSQFGFSAYPSGIIGRRTGIIYHPAWQNVVANQQSSINAAVQIDAQVNYNSVSREVSVTTNLIALEDLTGEYRVNYILVESGIIYPQVNGSQNYVHKNVNKGMINGDLGTIIHQSSAGIWDKNSSKQSDMTHILASDVVPENAEIAVIVWKSEGSLSTSSHVMNSIHFPVDNTTNITTIGTAIPDEYKLSQNFPNPFNPVTKINFDLPFESKVTMKVLDVTGREVAMLVNGNQPAGFYSVEFDASNIASGIYFYRMIAEGNNQPARTGGQFVMTKKMILLR